MRLLACCLLGFFNLAQAASALETGARVGPLPLVRLDGGSIILTNYAERKGTVIVFLSARDAWPSVEARALGEWASPLRLRGVLFVGVFPNAAETATEVRRFAQGAGLTFPVYRDPQQLAASRFGARMTPEAFLLDDAGTLIYRGAVGGTNGAGLFEAIHSFLAGRAPEVNHVPATGTPIGQSRPRREVEDPFGTLAFSSELIFERIPEAPAHHCATITEAANGDLVAVWYGGSYESADDQTLFLSRRKKGERAWSTPEALIRDAAQPPGNAVIFRAGGRRLCLVWARMEASRPLRRGGGWGQTRLQWRTSEDHGVTWSQDRPFLGGLSEGLRNVPITLASGDLLLPLAHSFAQSTDGGRTWVALGAVNTGGQPTVIERADGSLFTLLRQGPRILQSKSRDGGRTWSPAAATELDNPDAGIAMTRLRNGHLVLVFNDSTTERTPLSIARSFDEGWTWKPPLSLESNPGEYSYPCVIQAADGRIHVTYTFRRHAIKHLELNEDWLAHLERPN